jgi:hypothetical protein
MAIDLGKDHPYISTLSNQAVSFSSLAIKSEAQSFQRNCSSSLFALIFEGV